MEETKKFETQWGGKTLSIEVGKYANQANGSCMIRYGDTVLLATATMSSEKKDNLDFFPLTVDYEERLYAAGRIKGSRFVKKDGRTTDEGILIGRFIDRAIRPLFRNDLRNEVQVIVTTLVFDGENDPDIIGLIGASCALHISDIPWDGPICATRVGQVEGEWVLNPTYSARTKSAFDLSFAGTKEKVVMVEAAGNEASEQIVIDAFDFGMKHMEPVIKLINEVRASVGKEKTDPNAIITDEDKAKKELSDKIATLATPFIREKTKEYFFGKPRATKKERNETWGLIHNELIAFLTENNVEKDHIHYGVNIIDDVVNEEIVNAILNEDKRVDGRGLNEVRTLDAEVACLPRVHGSGYFLRGETRVLSVLTLGAPGDAQLLDNMETTGEKRFMHHYNFPPYSVGEVKPMRGPGRREIGHGALAEKALDPMIPSKEDFPYTIRVVSEVLSSNGSSSMASCCGTTLALMDGGVPIKAPVAGIAMGLASDASGKWKIFTDLQDLEDGMGGMDFKIAGSRNGITAIQMDTKTSGLTFEMVKEAIEKAKTARFSLLDVLEKAITAPRADLSSYAPRIVTLRVKPERIGEVIGPAGKMINEIIAQTGVKSIDIEQDGLVMITSTDSASAKKAEEWINGMMREVIPGEIFNGKVTRIMDFGAFVEVLPKKEGLVHISEIADHRIEKVTDALNVGDAVTVRVIEIDSMGRINLSIKQANSDYVPQPHKSSPPRDRGGFRGGNRHRNG